MDAEALWRQYAQISSVDAEWEAWSFDGAPDHLAALAAGGVKTATSSAFDLYARKGEPLPYVGGYSVILDSRKNAVCIIRTTKVYITPFREVSPLHAYREGEGDRSLACWRTIHRDFFTSAFSEAGLAFQEDSRIVCEEFEVIYKPDQQEEHHVCR